jgi:hypothetical protein
VRSPRTFRIWGHGKAFDPAVAARPSLPWSSAHFMVDCLVKYCEIFTPLPGHVEEQPGQHISKRSLFGRDGGLSFCAPLRHGLFPIPFRQLAYTVARIGSADPRMQSSPIWREGTSHGRSESRPALPEATPSNVRMDNYLSLCHSRILGRGLRRASRPATMPSFQDGERGGAGTAGVAAAGR